MSTEASDRRIFIDALDGAFSVTVEPPPEGQSFDRSFLTHKAARGWAGGCRLTHGGKIVDRTCPADAPPSQQRR